MFVVIPLLATTGIAGAVMWLSRRPERSTFPVLGVPDGLERQPDWSAQGRSGAAGGPPPPAAEATTQPLAGPSVPDAEGQSSTGDPTDVGCPARSSDPVDGARASADPPHPQGGGLPRP